MPYQPWHAVRFHRRQRRIEAARGKPSHLVQRASLNHRCKSLLDATHKFLAFARDEGFRGTRGIQQWRQAFTVAIRQWPTSRPDGPPERAWRGGGGRVG